VIYKVGLNSYSCFFPLFVDLLISWKSTSFSLSFTSTFMTHYSFTTYLNAIEMIVNIKMMKVKYKKSIFINTLYGLIEFVVATFFVSYKHGCSAV
jgi:hypothetical protein